MLTNNIISFEQLGPDHIAELCRLIWVFTLLIYLTLKTSFSVEIQKKKKERKDMYKSYLIEVNAFSGGFFFFFFFFFFFSQKHVVKTHRNHFSENCLVYS